MTAVVHASEVCGTLASSVGQADGSANLTLNQEGSSQTINVVGGASNQFGISMCATSNGNNTYSVNNTTEIDESFAPQFQQACGIAPQPPCHKSCNPRQRPCFM